MKKNLKNRILALLLSAAMIAVEAPAAFADDLLPEAPAIVETEESTTFEEGSDDLFVNGDEDETPAEESFTDAEEEPEITDLEDQDEESAEEPGQTDTDPEIADETFGEAKEDSSEEDFAEDSDASLDDERAPSYEIAYLSPDTVKQFNQNELDAYQMFCADAEKLHEEYPGVQDIVLSVNRDGEISLSYFVPNDVFAEQRDEFFEGIDLPDGETDMIPDPEEAEDAVFEEILEDFEAEDTEDALSEMAGEISEEPGEEELIDDFDTLTDLSDKEEVTIPDSVEEYIEENVELAAASAVAEEEIEGEAPVDIDTLFQGSDINYFRKQLTSYGMKVYDTAKSRMVKGKANSFTVNSYLLSSNISDGLSALITTYPGNFGWLDHSANGGWKGQVVYSWGRGYRTSVTVKKSKHYNKKLQDDANKKIKQLVNEAYTYAGANFPTNPTYGIVKYFDAWICNNNYYNNTGIAKDAATRATSTYYYCHSPYGVLLKGYGVCESYALGMSCLLDAAGVWNIYVVGYADNDPKDGGHAWNYVRMPNNVYYLQDSTFNDTGGGTAFLLAKGDSRHTATGKFYDGCLLSLRYPSLSSSSYAPGGETVTLNSTSKYLKTKKKFTFKINQKYYEKFKKTWKSSDTKVATVNKKGKMTTKGAGRATISCTMAGRAYNATVVVYQFTKLKFSDGKTSIKSEYGNPDTVFNASDVTTYAITVGQKNEVVNAQNIMANASLAAPKVSYSKKGIATATATLSGDTITLRVQPQKFGSTKIKVKFGGKTATLNYSCKRLMTAGMLDYTAITNANNTVYTGKAIKPSVKKSAAAPKDLKYSVTYKNNKDAGTATVIIKGKDKYTGIVTKTFQIAKKNLTDANVTARMNAKRTYNGKVAGPNTVIKVGKKTLKRAKDYSVSFSAVPLNAGTCQVTVSGMGNYSGSRPLGTYEITKAKAKKVKVSCASTVKFDKKKGGGACPKVKVMLGKNALQKGTDYTLIYRSVTNPGVTYGETAVLPKGKYQAEVTYTSRNLDLTGTTGKVIKKFTVK